MELPGLEAAGLPRRLKDGRQYDDQGALYHFASEAKVLGSHFGLEAVYCASRQSGSLTQAVMFA